MDTSLEIKSFELFDKKWALLTAGTIENHNSMTISWGGTGTLWSKPVVTVYVKPCRYTHIFMEENDYFVVSFSPEEYRKKLLIMGSKSGRENNKDELSGLTPVTYKNVTIYQEAEMTIICKKIYHQQFDLKNIPQKDIDTYYLKEEPHTMYVGEVIDILQKGVKRC